MRRSLAISLLAMVVSPWHVMNAEAQSSHPIVATLSKPNDSIGEGKNQDEVYISVLEYPISVEGMGPVLALNGVRHLSIGYFPDVVQIDGDAQATVGKLTELRGLEVFITGVEEKDWAFLTQLEKLESLWINGEGLKFGDQLLKAVAKLEHLESLRIDPLGDFSDEGVAKLVASRTLTEVRLSSTHLTDRSLDMLGEIEHLKILNLWSPKFTDAAAERLVNSMKCEEVAVNDFSRERREE
jgi:hypothetical protein